MRSLLTLLTMSIVVACTAPSTPEPSLASRAAETVDPRVPIPDVAPAAAPDPALASKLEQLVGEARSGAPLFDAKQANAERLVTVAGPMASEGWVAAQQALSLLIEQYGITTRAAANIDELASNRLQGERWIKPADQQAIAAAAAEVAAISDRQSAVIERLQNQLAR